MSKVRRTNRQEFYVMLKLKGKVVADAKPIGVPYVGAVLRESIPKPEANLPP